MKKTYKKRLMLKVISDLWGAKFEKEVVDHAELVLGKKLNRMTNEELVDRCMSVLFYKLNKAVEKKFHESDDV